MIVEPLDTPASSTFRVRCAIHPVQFGIFPNRLILPHPDDEVLSDYEEDVSSMRDGYTAEVEADPRFYLRTPLCQFNRIPSSMLAQDRRLSSPNLEHRFNGDVPNR